MQCGVFILSVLWNQKYNDSHSCRTEESGIPEQASCIYESTSHFKLQSSGMKALSKQHQTWNLHFNHQDVYNDQLGGYGLKTRKYEPPYMTNKPLQRRLNPNFDNLEKKV